MKNTKWEGKVKQRAWTLLAFPKLYRRSPPWEQALKRFLYEHNTKLIITCIFTHFTNLKAKESCNWWLTRSILVFRQQKSNVKYLPMSVADIGMLQEPFRKRKWCLRDFADTQEGLRNHFAAKDYSRRAAKLASILRFPDSSLRHISGNFRRKYTTLYKKAAKSLRNKRVISQHFAKCFLQLGVIDLEWL